MTDLVRVKDNQTHHEHNLPADRVKGLGDAVTVIEKPTHNADGTEVPPRYKTTVAKKAAENRATEPATEKGTN